MVERTSELRSRGNDDEISLSSIFSTLKQSKLLISAITVAVTSAALLYAVFAKPLYTASITVMPVTDNSSGTLSNLGGGLTGAAALAGLDLGSTGTDKQEYIAILGSRDLARKFIATHNLLPELFPNRWNASEKSWTPISHNFRTTLSQWLAEVSNDEGWRKRDDPVPSEGEAYGAFERIWSVKLDEATGVLQIEFEFRDPRRSAQWANAFVALANDTIRQRDIDEASRALDYLNQQVQETSIAGLRDTLYTLVEKQLETITTANARRDYAFRVIDPAVIPEQRSSPQRFLIVILGLFLGLMIGVLIALIAQAHRGNLNKD